MSKCSSGQWVQRNAACACALTYSRIQFCTVQQTRKYPLEEFVFMTAQNITVLGATTQPHTHKHTHTHLCLGAQALAAPIRPQMSVAVHGCARVCWCGCVLVCLCWCMCE